MGDTLAASRLAIATVCLSGTLEDKLRAAAAAGFHGVEIFENDLVASPWSPAPGGQEAAAPRPVDRGLSAASTSRRSRPTCFAANLRRAERKFDVLEQLGASVLVCSSSTASGRRRRPRRRAAARAGRPRRAARPAHRLRGLAWGRFVHATRTPGGSSAAPTIPRSACAWTASTCCPAATTRAGSGASPAPRCSTSSSPTRRG